MTRSNHPNAACAVTNAGGGLSDSGGNIPAIETRIGVIEQAMLDMQRSLHELIALQQRPPDPPPRGHGGDVPPEEHAFQANPKPTVLDFPWFHGAEVNDWVFQANNYFQSMKTPAHNKVEVASHYLFGDALKWYKVKLKNREDDIWTWSDFVRCVVTRFSPKKTDDPMADLCNLKQINNVESYVNQFNAIYDRIDVCDTYGRSLFLAGLKPELAHLVRMFKPQSFEDAVELALSTEVALPTLRSITTPENTPTNYTSNTPNTYTSNRFSYPNTKNTNPAYPRPTQTNPSQFKPSTNQLTSNNTTQNSNCTPQITNTKAQNLPFQTLDEKTIKDRIAAGLCKYCGEKFFRGHKCQSRQFFLMVAGNEEQDATDYGCGEEGEETAAMVEEPTASLYAIHNSKKGGAKAMRVVLQVQKQAVHTLIDTGSTHNLISKDIALALGIPIASIAPVKIMLANGEALTTTEACLDIKWCIQGEWFEVSAFILPLIHYDVIWGMEWLETLGPVLWDFKRMEMKFGRNGREMVLKGGANLSAKWINEEKFKAIEEWPQLPIVKQVRGFLGLTGYYSRFIKGYASLAKPLTDILTTTFKALFEIDPPLSIPSIPHNSNNSEVNRVMMEREQAIQPYKQLSLAQRPYQQLSPKYFGPFKMLDKIGPVASQLDLPASSLVQAVIHLQPFHSSCLADTSPVLIQPVSILGLHIRKRQGVAATQLEVAWTPTANLPPSWEWADHLHATFLHSSLWARKLNEGALSQPQTIKEEEAGRKLDI